MRLPMLAAVRKCLVDRQMPARTFDMRLLPGVLSLGPVDSGNRVVRELAVAS